MLKHIYGIFKSKFSLPLPKIEIKMKTSPHWSARLKGNCELGGNNPAHPQLTAHEDKSAPVILEDSSRRLFPFR